MKWFSGLSTLVIAGALLAAPTGATVHPTGATVHPTGATVHPAYAHDRSAGASASDPNEGLARPYGDDKTMQDMQDRETMGNPPLKDEQASTSIEGQVAAVDHDSGQLVLDTDEGLVNIQSSPEELTQIDVGDVVRVSVVQNLSE